MWSHFFENIIKKGSSVLSITSALALLDVPFGVMMDSILLELIPVIIAGICIALKIKEGVSLQWGVPVLLRPFILV